MTDYCIYCGNSSAIEHSGNYIEMTDNESLGLFTEVFLCRACESRIREEK